VEVGVEVGVKVVVKVRVMLMPSLELILALALALPFVMIYWVKGLSTAQIYLARNLLNMNLRQKLLRPDRR